jgi:hypothetical protein
MAQTPFSEIRDHYLEPVRAEITRILEEGRGNGRDGRPRILEVGAGNGTNLVKLREAYGDRVDFQGIDLSTERLRVGQTYYGERLPTRDEPLLAAGRKTSFSGQRRHIARATRVSFQLAAGPSRKLQAYPDHLQICRHNGTTAHAIRDSMPIRLTHG